ncbi:MAG TPA: hypothetical protein VNA20_10235 [Frankiaceae bacterium]|nr:hypothetical protein [Frankiaceae bacterium]
MWIADWVWDDDNIEHIARHGLTVWDVRDVWLMYPKFRRNRKGRAATHQMIGADGGGRFLAVFIAEVPGRPGWWRVVTARAATDDEKKWWARS